MISNVSIKLSDEAVERVVKVLESGYLVQGPNVKEFEERFADFCGTDHAVAVSNGTTGLHIGLLALGVGPGDEVISTPFSFVASGTSILFTGARPVFVDVDPKTFNIDPEAIEKAITPKTKAIMPVHLYGQCAGMTQINRIAKEHGIAVLEDSCQSHGAMHNGKKAGSIGDAGVFSFYPTKNMTTGEGGIVTTNSQEVMERLRLLRNHGQDSRYSHLLLGFNFRMTDIGGAIGLAELKLLEGRTERRRRNAEYLIKELRGLVETPYTAPENLHVYHQFTIKSDNRQEIIDSLQANEIGYGIYYPKPIPSFKPFENARVMEIPNTEKLILQALSLPVHQDLSQDDLEKIVRAVKTVFS